MDRPIADQVADAAAELGGATALVVVSPYLLLDAAQGLATRLGCDDVSVCVPLRSPSQFDFAAARQAGLDARPVTAEAFQDQGRILHAKIVEVTCRRGRLTLTGSVNATRAAMLSTRNVELAVLRTSARPSLVGWRACPEPTPLSAAFPAGSSEPCLVARHEGDRVRGRLMFVPQPEGQWLAQMGFAAPGLSVDVDGEGRFAFVAAAEALGWGRAPQLTLRRGGVTASGWLILDQVLSAIRERGRLAEAFARLVAGAGEAEDIAAILGFFAANPEALAPGHIFTRGHCPGPPAGGGGSVARGPRVPAHAAIGQPSTFPVHSRMGGFERLLQLASVRCDPRAPAQAVPLRTSGGDQIDEDGEGRADSDDGEEATRVSADAVTRTLDALLARTTQEGEAGRERMCFVLGFIRFFSGHVRSEEREAFIDMALSLWRKAVWANVRSVAAAPDELDQLFCAVVTAEVLGLRMGFVQAHSQLQRWRGGSTDIDWVVGTTPDGAGALEQWLAPGAAPDTWKASWLAIHLTKTRWSWACRIAAQVSSGCAEPDLPDYLTVNERRLIHSAITSRDERAMRRVIKVHRANGFAACPRHGRVLPVGEANRFRSDRVALTECCVASLRNLDPRDGPNIT